MAEQEQPLSNKLWLSISQAAVFFGVEQKTIRRAIKSHEVAYVVEGNRYSVEIGSLIAWAHQSKKLHNKLRLYGIGKFVDKWRDEFLQPPL